MSNDIPNSNLTSKGIVRTFSFEGLGNNGIPVITGQPKDSTGAMQADDKSFKEENINESIKVEMSLDHNPSECLESRVEPAAAEEAKRRLEEIKSVQLAEEVKSATSLPANPFMSGEELRTPTTYDGHSVFQQPAPPLDKAPDYLPNRKAYTGSPDFVLAKRQNKLAKYLPKAFTVQMEDESKENKLRFLEQKLAEKTVNVKERNLLLTPPCKQNTGTTQQSVEVFTKMWNEANGASENGKIKKRAVGCCNPEYGGSSSEQRGSCACALL